MVETFMKEIRAFVEEFNLITNSFIFLCKTWPSKMSEHTRKNSNSKPTKRWWEKLKKT